MKAPKTRYASSSGARIAYQSIGHGPIDLVFVPGLISNLDLHWEDPGFTHLLRRLSTFARLILFDKRGTGLSDRVDPANLPDLATQMEDLRAVMDAVGSGRAAVLGASDGAALSILFAAAHPERVRALVLYGACAHVESWATRPEAIATFLQQVETSWGSGATLAHFAPGSMDDAFFADWWARFERLSASPTAAVALAAMAAKADVRDTLKDIRVPTLVLHRNEDVRIKAAGGQYLADHIPGARFVALPGRDHPIWTGDVDHVVDEIEEFLTGARAMSDRHRVLSTLMMARLVAPHRMAAQVGDRMWSARLERFQQRAAEAIARHGGKTILAGSGDTGARFDGPARAIRCALALREAARTLDLPLAAGIHAGEVELRDDTVAGLALHVVERIAAQAPAGEVFVSGVVGDLVAGSGLHFSARPDATIDGLETPLRLLAVIPEQHLQPVARTAPAPDLAALSVREREVLTLVADGLSNAAIATRLSLSEHTVKRHIANILLKLDLPTRAAAAALIGRQRRTTG